MTLQRKLCEHFLLYSIRKLRISIGPMDLLFLIQCVSCELIVSIICCRAANVGRHTQKGWPNSAYGTSKMCVTQITGIQQKQFDSDTRQDIVINSVSKHNVFLHNFIILKNEFWKRFELLFSFLNCRNKRRKIFD